MPTGKAEQQSGQGFYQGVARANGGAAVPAFATKYQIADYGNVFQRAYGVLTFGTGGAWGYQVVACLFDGGLALCFQPLLCPGQFHHARQSMDNHVEKAARHQAQQYRGANKQGRACLQFGQERENKIRHKRLVGKLFASSHRYISMATHLLLARQSSRVQGLKLSVVVASLLLSV